MNIFSLGAHYAKVIFPIFIFGCLCLGAFINYIIAIPRRRKWLENQIDERTKGEITRLKTQIKELMNKNNNLTQEIDQLKVNQRAAIVLLHKSEDILTIKEIEK